MTLFDIFWLCVTLKDTVILWLNMYNIAQLSTNFVLVFSHKVFFKCLQINHEELHNLSKAWAKFVPNSCPIVAQYLTNICQTFAQHFCPIITKYFPIFPQCLPARNLHKICLILARYMPRCLPNICQIFADNLQNICPKLAQYMPNICKIIAQYVYNICPIFAPNIQEILAQS